MIDVRLGWQYTMKDHKGKNEAESELTDRPKSIGRRSMLKGTATALPAVLTLQSGAALAQSSNLINTTPYKTTDRRGRTLCLDLQSVRPARGRQGNSYDIGSHGYAEVYRIPERDYYAKRRNGRWRPIDESALCERGGIAAHKVNGRMQEVKLPVRRGGMISVTAVASMADKIIVYDI